MNTYAYPPEKHFKTDLQSLVQHCPEDPMVKIAVLFTDIVGSTDYFKAHGDKLGRDMLRSHHDIASSVIAGHGGKVIKLIGDSIMAYFLYPAEAFKAAIKMQQRYQMENGKGDTAGQMHVRVGIHYGSVIVEKEDIYGDVVNVASKLTSLARGDQVYISHEVYDLVKDVPLVHFDLLPNWDRKNIPDGLIVYRVFWDEAVELNPATSIMLYARPVTVLGDSKFNTIWEDFTMAENALWEGKKKKKKVFPDKSIMMFFTEAGSANGVAAGIRDFISDKLEEAGQQTPFPVQIVIDVSYDFSEDDLISNGYHANQEEIIPGDINFSEDAYHIIKNFENVPIVQVSEGIGGRIFYRVVSPGEEKKAEIEMFPYGNALVRGPYDPCYYCGSRKHMCTDCPSKNLPDITHALNRLGYLSLKVINELFLKLFLSEEANPDAVKEDEEKNPDTSIKLPYYSFYELTRVYQLRFFRAIWNATGEDWLVVREDKSETQGGLVWLAQDSLRISDLDKAESTLRKVLENKPDDFRVYCILGYFCIEKSDFVRAESYFDTALSHVKMGVHKTFIQLLIARLYVLNNKPRDASKMIGDILLKNPHCIDAVYMDIIIKFQQREETLAIQRLIKLIQNNREYFMYAYMDPELIPYSDFIIPQMIILFRRAKEDATSLLPVAENEYAGSKEMHDKQSVAEIQSLFLKVKNTLALNSYFGYLDAADYCSLITSKCRDLFKERKKALTASVHLLDIRVKKDLEFVDTYTYQRLAGSYRNQLQIISEKFDRVLEAMKSISHERFDEYESVCDELSDELKHVESKFENLYYLKQCMQSFFRFAKCSLISLSIVLVIGFFIFPLFAYYLNVVLLRLDVSPISNVRFYQKLFFIGGGALGLCIPLFIAIKDLIRND
ncbi:MAG: hypothetical protein NTX75_07015 [Proteobacteria bacterium]|nr:hypothetical protein [Pseudomonadota bacterium]